MLKALATVLLTIVTLTTTGHAQARPFVMKVSSPTINDAAMEWMRQFKTGVEARTGGRIRVELYPANQLGQLPATIEGVAMGTIEMTITAAGFLVGLEPRFQVFDLPDLFDGIEHGRSVLTESGIAARVSSFGATKGIEPLFVYLAGPSMLLTHRPIETLDDLKGLKIRAVGGAPLYKEPLRKRGANPILMPLGEVLASMQNRTIDGTVAGLAPFVEFKFHDVARNLTEVPGAFLVTIGLTNRAFMKALGPELEAIVRNESRKAETAFASWNVAELKRLRGRWTQSGGRIKILSPVERDKYVATVRAAAAPLLQANPQIREDYEALLGAANRNRVR
jgi:TRAP-type transport system periplasmic protein